MKKRFAKDGRAKPWLAEYLDKDGKKRSPGFATEEECDRFIVAFESRPVTPDDADDTATTPERGKSKIRVGVYLDTWLKGVQKNREGKTYKCYEQLVRNHIKPRIGTLRMRDLDAPRALDMYDQMKADGVKLASRKHVHSCLSSALTEAVFLKILPSNPILRLGSRLRQKDEEAMDPEPNPMTPAQADAFLDYIAACETDWLEYFQFLHDAGPRVGEVAALKWPCVDLDHARAKIELSYSPADQADKDPKTHQRRWIDLTDLVVEQLRALKTRQQVDSLRKGRPVPKYVFTNRNGSPRRQDGNMRRVFDRAIVGLKFDPESRAKTEGLDTVPRAFSPHALRDTFATTHLTLDYNRLGWVSRQLGHEKTRTTEDHYFRFLPSSVSKGFANGIRPPVEKPKKRRGQK